jgi:hypothetical protein
MVDETTESETSNEADDIIEDEKAESSPVESETEADLLSVIKDAAQPEEEPESHSESEEVERDEVAAESTESDADVEFADQEEDYSNLPFHKHPRFKELVQQRNEAKESAQKFDVMQNYLATNNLSGDEAAIGLDIMVKMKSDPMAALTALKPYVQQLSQAAGIVMPQDIQTRVDDGYLDEDAGRELSRARAEAARQKQQNEMMLQQQNAQVQQQQINYLAETVTDWEENTRASDPDYDLKEDLIDARVRSMIAERGQTAQTPQEAIQLAQSAYDQVNQKFNAKFGNRPSMKTASGGKLGGSPAPEPQSLQEAIAAAMGNS